MVYTVKYSIYSTVKKEANQYSNISWLLFSIEWLEDLLGAETNACSPNSRNLPLWTWSEQTMQSVSTSYSNKYLQIEKYSIIIERVSISTIRRILVKHQITMKQLYRVPFERNSVRVKGLRREYVQVSVTVLYIYNTVLESSSYSWICAIVSVPHRYIQRGTRYLFDGVGVLYV